MKRSKKGVLVLCLSVLAAVCFLVVAVALGAELPKLQGVTVSDERPNGCVSCHVKGSGDQDYSIPAYLKRVEKHPPIEKIVKVVPSGCAVCHKEGGKAAPLSVVAHKNHFSNPKENKFVTMYNGDCLNCHALDMNTFKMSVKSGPANW